WMEKQSFFEHDRTARYLTEQIAAGPPRRADAPARGSFARVVEEADLDPAATFLLSLSLIAAFDSASGPGIAACHNDANRTAPTLALAQKLWDAPAEVLSLADPMCPLFRFGLLRHLDAASDWDAPLYTPELIARRLLFPDAPRPALLRSLSNSFHR